jgi:methionyl-tRNA formyltransferase
MIGGDVGTSLIKWLVQNYRDDIELVVCRETEAGLIPLLDEHKVPHMVWGSIKCTEDEIALRIKSASIQVGFLLWWPDILGTDLLSAPRYGFINLHPSLLPFGRGKHPNFWSIKDGEPFGVSIHLVDKLIDHGPVLVQRPLEISWLDNGKTIYDKSITEIASLFKENYANLGKMVESQTFKVQDFERGSFHISKQLDEASVIELDHHYLARDLLNLIRARTFYGRPSCFFLEGGKRYSVIIKIEELKQ